MTERSDYTISYGVSPRVLIIDHPSEEFVVQDQIDTLAAEQAKLDVLDDDGLYSAAGKELLEGTTTVGLTNTLLNLQIGFAPPPASISSGTVTTQDTTGRYLVDSAADFDSDGVTPGDTIINITDNAAYGTVLDVISLTKIETTLLRMLDGNDNQFDSGDVYKIIPTKQCDLGGGNTVAVDGIGDPLNPIFPTAFTQIIKTSSSSATLADIEAIQYSSYNGGVTIDVINGQSGTTYPIGTPEYPVDNWNDAKAIAIDRGFHIFYVEGYFTFGATDNLSGYDFRACNPLTSVVTLTVGCTTANTIFRNCTIQGTANGKMLIYECYIMTLAGFNGTINWCGFLGTITLAGSTVCHVVHCYDGFEGFGEPIIDFGGSGRGLNMRDYQGGIRFENKSGSEDVSVGLNGGRLEIAGDVTAGEIVVRGVGEISENLGTATIADDGLVNPSHTSDHVWDEAQADHLSAGSMGASLFNTLGLSHENHSMDQIVYDGDVVTSARIRLYSDPASVGTDSDVISTYAITGTHTDDQVTLFKGVKV